MEKTVYALNEHEVFMREFISLYKEHSVLWNQKHPHYRNRAERAVAYGVLVKKSQQYYPDADEDFVRMKIDSMRSSFRKERKKVLRSRENSDDAKDVYKPSLWYYDLLLFTTGELTENRPDIKEEVDLPNGQEENNLMKIPFWNREYSAILIDLYKNHPCLYATNHGHYRNKRKRKDAVKDITENLIEATGKYFHTDDVRKKISLIRGQFLYEFKKVKSSESLGETYTPSLWCFEMLSFLKKQYNKKRRICPKREIYSRNKRRRKSTTDESTDDLDIKKESDSSTSSLKKESDSSMCSEVFLLETTENSEKDTSVEREDIYDTIAKNVAHKMRDMTEEQRNIAEKIIKDVMYHGQMENLSDKSRLSLDGT